MALPQIITRLVGRFVAVLPVQTSAGAGDAEKIPALDATGKLDLSLLPSGTGPTNAVIEASEALTAGEAVNIWNDGGTAKVRKADANAAGKQAHGFVLDAYSSTDPAVVYFEGTVTGLSGLTPGAYQWLSDTAGDFTETPPTGAGTLSQILGVALSATEIEWFGEEPVTLAA